ncbi:MAG: thiolase family protein [Planctomycetota bacterium]|jgi:acetyl-CoA acetyltransferase
MYEKTYIPYGGYWSSPFVKWQGSFAPLHPIRFVADMAKRFLGERNVPAKALDGVVLGITIPQKHLFYGAPWFAGLIGADHVTGPMIGQACATGARCLDTAGHQVEAGVREAILVATCDRCSNGPHIYYPNPMGPGGTGDKEDWVWDNFGFDPFARNPMVQTGENCAAEGSITREEQDEMTLLRHAQYQDSLKDDAAFQKRYMLTPVEVNPSGRKVIGKVEGDEGVFPTPKEGLAKLKPVLKEGTITFGSQTFPADANAGLLVTSKGRAAEMSKDKNVEVQIVSFGEGRAKKGFMAQAIIPAAHSALKIAGIGIGDVKAIKTHNPFAVNDVLFCREMGVKPEAMNRYGSSLIYGHPQGPTGTRLIIELIEELALAGGGLGLFDGCAAGDTGAAVVLKVDVKS